MESGLGKVFDLVGSPKAIAMNRYGAEDIYERRNVEGGVNIYHSQGTIIGVGAMHLFADTYQRGVDLNGNILPEGPAVINNTQLFYAVGPAVLKPDWKAAARALGSDIGKNAGYEHDNLDSIRYLAAPSNLVNDLINPFVNQKDLSPVYIPNPISTVIGIITLPFIEHHDVKNPIYSKSLQDLENNEPKASAIKILQLWEQKLSDANTN